MKTVFIAEDHPIVLKGLESHLKPKPGFEIIGTAMDGEEALKQIEKLNPDIAILDIYMPGMTGLQILEKLHKGLHKTKCILLTTFKEKLLFEKAKKLNVSAYLLKDFAIDEIDHCLEMVAMGRSYFSKHLDELLDASTEVDLSIFTKTEMSILKLIALDKSSSEIAEILFSSPKTIENHRGNISKKLNLDGKSHNLYKWVIRYKELIGR